MAISTSLADRTARDQPGAQFRADRELGTLSRSFLALSWTAGVGQRGSTTEHMYRGHPYPWRRLSDRQVDSPSPTKACSD